MKAIVIGRDSRLEWGTADDAKIRTPDDVLVETRASAVNRADLLQAAGAYPAPPGESPILGLEMAGRIIKCGSAVHAWNVGDRVCALLPGGGYAEQAAVPQGLLMKLPASWSYAQGAAIPEVWLTAFLNLFIEGQLRPGETVLIHAGASGVGTAGIQMAVASGARVFVTVGSDAKMSACHGLGAELAINRSRENFAPVVSSKTDGEGVDLILDPVGADYFGPNLDSLRPLGRLVLIGLLSGSQTGVDLGLLLRKRLRIVGSTLRNRPLSEKVSVTTQFVNRFWPGLESGSLKPVIDSEIAMPDAQAAHDYVRGNRNTGKVILTLE